MSRFSLLSRGFAVAVCLALGSPLPAAADPPVDLYLDAIAPDSEVVIDNPGAMLGAPDGQLAKVTGAFGKRLVVDLGAGERGVGDLEVVFTNPPNTLTQDLYPDFLDAQGRRVGYGSMIMIGLGGPRTVTVHNSSAKPYRYISMVTTTNDYYFDSMKTAALATPGGDA